MAATKTRLTAADLVAASRVAPSTNAVATEQRRPFAARAALISAEIEAQLEQFRVVKNLVRDSAAEVIAQDNLAFVNAYRVKNGLEPI